MFTFAKHKIHTSSFFFFLYRNLQKLSLYGDTSILQDDGILDSSYLSQVNQGVKKMKEYVLKLNATYVNWLQSYTDGTLNGEDLIEEAGFANIRTILLVLGIRHAVCFGLIH